MHRSFYLPLITSIILTNSLFCSMPIPKGHKTAITKKTRDNTLVLYFSPSCPYCQKVLRYLDKIGKTLPMKNTQNDANARVELKNLGGKTQVPCLFINGKALYESDAIIDWLSKHQKEL